jgi:hypothetical protein
LAAGSSGISFTRARRESLRAKYHWPETQSPRQTATKSLDAVRDLSDMLCARGAFANTALAAISASFFFSNMNCCHSE